MNSSYRYIFVMLAQPNLLYIKKKKEKTCSFTHLRMGAALWECASAASSLLHSGEALQRRKSSFMREKKKKRQCMSVCILLPCLTMLIKFLWDNWQFHRRTFKYCALSKTTTLSSTCAGLTVCSSRLNTMSVTKPTRIAIGMRLM